MSSLRPKLFVSSSNGKGRIRPGKLLSPLKRLSVYLGEQLPAGKAIRYAIMMLCTMLGMMALHALGRNWGKVHVVVQSVGGGIILVFTGRLFTLYNLKEPYRTDKDGVSREVRSIEMLLMFFVLSTIPAFTFGNVDRAIFAYAVVIYVLLQGFCMALLERPDKVPDLHTKEKRAKYNRTPGYSAVKTASYAALLVYSELLAWGMHSIGKNNLSKLVDFRVEIPLTVLWILTRTFPSYNSKYTYKFNRIRDPLVLIVMFTMLQLPNLAYGDIPLGQFFYLSTMINCLMVYTMAVSERADKPKDHALAEEVRESPDAFDT